MRYFLSIILALLMCVSSFAGTTSVIKKKAAAGLTRSDNFNRDNEDPLGNGNWTKDTARVAPKIVSNQVVPATSGWGAAYWSADTFAANQYSQIKIVTANNEYAGPMVRHNNDPSLMYGYWTYVSYGEVRIFRTSSGGGVNSGGTALCTTSINGKILKLTASGSAPSVELHVYIDETECGSGWTDASADAVSTGQPGLMVGYGEVIDDWQGGDL